MGEPLTLKTPFPDLMVALATAFFFFPKHWTSWDLVYDMIIDCYMIMVKNNQLLN
jgi:hypothetical protein